MQNLSNTAWAFATSSQQDAQVFAAFAREAELRLGDFKVQELANTAWAFATASQQDAQVFAAFAMSTQMSLGDFRPQELVSIASAFAKVGRPEPLFTALAREAERRVGDF